MVKFLTSNKLNSELEKLIEDSQTELILVSPYINLHERFISALKTKVTEDKLAITVVFGKNENDSSKSIKKTDYEFLKEFPNIQIRYEKRLHAKYYANEITTILTSMNLYTYSQDNNIEAGIMFNGSVIKVGSQNSFDEDAYKYFSTVIEQSKLIFKRVPEYENSMLGLTKKYKFSKTIEDESTNFFSSMSSIERKDLKKKNIASNVTIVKDVISLPVKEQEFITTTNLSKETGISNRELWNKFESMKLVQKENDKWILTDNGISMGATMKERDDFSYIAWPLKIKEVLQSSN